MSRALKLLRMVFVLAMLASLVYFGVYTVVLGVNRIADYEPPILLNCTPVCIPDLQHSVTIQKEHTQ